MRRHAPAPWTGSNEIAAADGTVIAEVYAVPSDEGTRYGYGTSDATCRLILAAPELLRALEDAEAQILYLRENLDARARKFTSGSTDICLRDLRAAIRRATGEGA